jgi:hypothetical protein
MGKALSKTKVIVHSSLGRLWRVSISKMIFSIGWHNLRVIDFNMAMKAIDSSIQLGAVGWISQTQYNNLGNKAMVNWVASVA